MFNKFLIYFFLFNRYVFVNLVYNDVLLSLDMVFLVFFLLRFCLVLLISFFGIFVVVVIWNILYYRL